MFKQSFSLCVSNDLKQPVELIENMHILNDISLMMNDNRNSRYRQLEMPMRKGNPVATQQKETRAIDNFDKPYGRLLLLEETGTINAYGRARIRQMWRNAQQRERTEETWEQPSAFCST